jgi:hypothetical protein
MGWAAANRSSRPGRVKRDRSIQDSPVAPRRLPSMQPSCPQKHSPTPDRGFGVPERLRSRRLPRTSGGPDLSWRESREPVASFTTARSNVLDCHEDRKPGSNREDRCDGGGGENTLLVRHRDRKTNQRERQRRFRRPRDATEDGDEPSLPSRFGTRPADVRLSTLFVETPLLAFCPTVQPSVPSHNGMFPASYGAIPTRLVWLASRHRSRRSRRLGHQRCAK